MFWFKKKSDDISKKVPGFEEAGERKTPFTGFLLLTIMFIAGVYFGWTALDDLSRIPTRPPELSYCSNRYRMGSTEYRRTSIMSPIAQYTPRMPMGPKGFAFFYEDSSGCVFGNLEKQYGVDDRILLKRVPLEQKHREISDKVRFALDDLYKIQNKQSVTEQQYNLGLQEKQAGIGQGVYPVNSSIQQGLLQLERDKAQFQSVVDGYTGEQEAIQKELRSLDEEITTAYKPVFVDQNRRERMYEFEIFILQFIFVLPLFFLILRQYLRLLRKNSPYTIIFTATVGVTGVLLLRVILQWFHGLFLAKVLEIILAWFQHFELLRSVVFYIGMLLSFLIFGGAVYYLQKKIFDPRRVALRRFRLHQCPHCQASLDLAGMMCPNCGEKIRMRCAQCGELRFIGLSFCPHCGSSA